MRLLTKHLSTIVVALAVSALVAAAPAIAHGVDHALFAHDAAKLDGVDGSRYVQGPTSSRVVSIRRSVPNGNTITLFNVPGLGRLRAQCLNDGNNARVKYVNNTGVAVDVWRDYQMDMGLDVIRKSSNTAMVDVAWFELASGEQQGSRLLLGRGTGTGTPGSARSSASLDIGVFKADGPTPCIFQVGGTSWQE